MLNKLKKELMKKANPIGAEKAQRFFKTGKGEYGDGDVFLGLTTPEEKEIVKKYFALCLDDIQKLLNDKIHEFRYAGISILVDKYEKALKEEKQKLVNFYLKNTRNINNWDLVDISAPHLIGDFLIDENKDILYKLAKSENLWERRIAIVSTFAFIRKGEFADTFAIAEMLLEDKHDLIHKAVGWMIREIGKRNQNALENFLKKHIKFMPRTMLRYAIEKFDEKKRKRYLKGEI